jgi:hypothetical protein
MSLTEAVTKCYDFSIFREHVAAALRNCSGHPVEIAVAQHNISEVLLHLQLCTNAPQIRSPQAG